MPFNGTDKDAYNRAKKGKTPAERSKLYNKYKNENLKSTPSKGWVGQLLSFNKNHDKPITNPKISSVRLTQPTVKKEEKKSRFVPRQLILDDIRNHRSSKIVSKISNSIATIIAKSTQCMNLSNDQMNLIRGSVALVASEVFNKVLEKPLEIIENIKMFVKVGKAIYKVVLWFNEQINNYEIEQSSLQEVSANTFEYLEFLNQYPKLRVLSI